MNEYERLKKQTDEIKQKQACKIVDEIISDLCGRSGGDHFFEGCDDEIQAEIRKKWVEIVRGKK